VHGAAEVAREVLHSGRPLAPFARPALVNGSPGAVVRREGRLVSVAAFTFVDGRIVEVDIVADPAKLAAAAALFPE
jgi:RNA polymerase sigma-70 factor (ECF subfamily)